MAEAPKLTLKVTFAWWLQPYMRALVFFAVITRSEPDWDKLGRVINRAMRIRVA